MRHECKSSSCRCIRCNINWLVEVYCSNRDWDESRRCAENSFTANSKNFEKKSFENSFHLSHGQLLAIRVFFFCKKKSEENKAAISLMVNNFLKIIKISWFFKTWIKLRTVFTHRVFTGFICLSIKKTSWANLSTKDLKNHGHISKITVCQILLTKHANFHIYSAYRAWFIWKKRQLVTSTYINKFELL